MSAEPRWIALDGAVNVRDLGGLPATDGRAVRPSRLIRSDNLQGLTDADITRLVDAHGVRAVADLRTQVEVDSEGPGPLTREPRVDIQHLSLFAEAGHNTDVVAADDDDAPVVLPWHKRETSIGDRRGAVSIYQRYLDDRPDSIVAALRLIARTDGATVVHCAAGKDRTGVVVALALDEVGVDRDEIVADFARTGERLHQILERLAATKTYAEDVGKLPADAHLPRATTMQNFLAELDSERGGTSTWLQTHGWTPDDAAALRGSLLD